MRARPTYAQALARLLSRRSGSAGRFGITCVLGRDGTVVCARCRARMTPAQYVEHEHYRGEFALLDDGKA